MSGVMIPFAGARGAASPATITLQDTSADDFTERVYIARITLSVTGNCTQEGDSVSPGTYTWIDDNTRVTDFQVRWTYNSGSTVTGPTENTWTDFNSSVAFQCTTSTFSSNNIAVEIRDKVTLEVRDTANFILQAGA